MLKVPVSLDLHGGVTKRSFTKHFSQESADCINQNFHRDISFDHQSVLIKFSSEVFF